jgi:hypothetical protein
MAIPPLLKRHRRRSLAEDGQFPFSQCDPAEFRSRGNHQTEKTAAFPLESKNQQNHQRREKWRNLQVTAPEVPVGGFVGFCPSSFTVSAVFHQTEDDLEIVL